jgi:hypothetical protein
MIKVGCHSAVGDRQSLEGVTLGPESGEIGGHFAFRCVGAKLFKAGSSVFHFERISSFCRALVTLIVTDTSFGTFFGR